MPFKKLHVGIAPTWSFFFKQNPHRQRPEVSRFSNQRCLEGLVPVLLLIISNVSYTYLLLFVSSQYSVAVIELFPSSTVKMI